MLFLIEEPDSIHSEWGFKFTEMVTHVAIVTCSLTLKKTWKPQTVHFSFSILFCRKFKFCWEIYLRQEKLMLLLHLTFPQAYNFLFFVLETLWQEKCDCKRNTTGNRGTVQANITESIYMCMCACFFFFPYNSLEGRKIKKNP